MLTASEQAADRLDRFIEEGRLIRKAWTGERDGRDTACLLAAMSPEVAKEKRASACPADIMPQWLAYLTPWIDDSGIKAAWPEQVEWFARLAHRWHVLTPERWRRLDYRVRAAILRCLPTTLPADVRSVVDRVIALCDRASRGEDVADKARAAAEATAEAAEAATEAVEADVIIAAILTTIEAAITEAENKEGGG